VIKRIIKSHVDKLTINDIYEFALKNGVHLNQGEVDIIYAYIKNYWNELIFHDHKLILSKVKDSLEPTTYQKINELIVFYKNKYKYYL